MPSLYSTWAKHLSDVKIKAESNDLSLLQSSSTGDRDAFDVFVRRHQAAVFRFASALSKSSSQAEEVLQGTFIEAWRGASGFTGQGTAKSWLFTIARRYLGRMRRKRAGQPSSFEDIEDIEKLGINAGWGSDGGTLAISLENREWVEKALARLRDTDQELLLLVELEGLSLQEAADTIGQSLTSTKSRLHRARLYLLAELRKENDIEG